MREYSDPLVMKLDRMASAETGGDCIGEMGLTRSASSAASWIEAYVEDL